MLKKLIIGSALLIAIAPITAVQADNDGSGCGLGQMILEGKSGKGPNIGAAILNNFVFPQTFAMSSGTMGCDTTETVQVDQERKVFVAQNMDSLSVDMAQGQGDYLASLADIMGIQAQDTSNFYSLTQEQFSVLSDTDSAEGMLAKLDIAMINDQSLAKYVQ